MAWYDPLNDKIIGGVPGTPAYRHEQGHQFLQRRFQFYFWKVVIDRSLLLIILWALAQGGPFDLMIARYLIVGMLMFDFLDELFAWVYAWLTRRPHSLDRKGLR